MDHSNRFSRTELLDGLDKLLPSGWEPPEPQSSVDEDPFSSHPILSIQLSDALHAARRARKLVAERSSDRQIIAQLVTVADSIAAIRPSLDHEDLFQAGRSAVTSCVESQAEVLLSDCSDAAQRESLHQLVDTMRSRQLDDKIASENAAQIDAHCRRQLIASVVQIAEQYGLDMACSVRRHGPRHIASALVEILDLVGQAAGFEQSVQDWAAFGSEYLAR